ncbi:MAG: sialidase family protein [Dehalococcoidia bacterium]|nr:sialidase family protein [Dehalococcoidia bacterium]
MRKLFVLWTLLLVLTVGCMASPATAPSGPAPAPTPAPEPTLAPKPTPEKEGITLEFVWTVDSGIRLEDATVPNIYRLEDGRLRMYYGGPGGILSAISQDGITFRKETGVRVPSGSPGSPEMIVSDPTLVTQKDGRMRMYYKSASGPGGPGQSVHSIYSAISTDGLRFEKEGIRIDSQQTPDRGWASVPEAIVLPDGRVRLYYVSDGLDVKHGIVSAISDDGLNFTREETKLTGFVDPAVLRLADGSYLMLAVAFPFGSGSRLTDAAPGIYSFLSEDGINFKDRELVLAGENNIDPAIVDLGDGAYRVYYWNVMDKPSVIKSMNGKMTSTSVPEPVAAPTIASVLAPRSIPGAKLWLFAVDDGNPRLAVSAESDGQLLMGRLDVTNPDTAVSWQTVAGPTDTGGVSIADHWHIFAHGYHWLIFSVAGDSASYLLKLNKDFQRLALVPVGHTDGPTNDMFLVAEPNGVAVAHFAPGYGHTVHRFDVQAKKTGQVRIGGGIFTHANGSSAIPVEGGYLLFSSETLNPSVTSAVRLIQFDTAWRPVNVRAVLDEDGTNAVMPTAVRLGSGYTVVNLRIRTGVSPRQKEPPAPQPGSLLPDDSGALVRLVLTPDGTIVSRETLVSNGANRAHTTLVGDLLVTTWDENGTARVRVDRVQ